jgi:hypothetical protein
VGVWPARGADRARAARRPEAAAWRWDASADAQWAYGAFFGLLALGQLPAAQATRLADLPYFVGLATLTIYIGAHRGLSSRSRQQISLRQARRGRALAFVQGLRLLRCVLRECGHAAACRRPVCDRARASCLAWPCLSARVHALCMPHAAAQHSLAAQQPAAPWLHERHTSCAVGESLREDARACWRSSSSLKHTWALNAAPVVTK